MQYQTLFGAFSALDGLRDRELSVLLDRLLLSIARRILGKEDKSEGRLAKSISYVNMRYNEKIKIPHLAKLEGLSVSRYNTIFKQIVGISPTQYITKTRITAASELLCNTDMSVCEVGYAVGYPDSHFFSKIFKAQTGKSPTGFRCGTQKTATGE